MVLKYHISPAPAILEDLVVKIWEAGSDGPGGEVYTQVIPEDAPGTGHANPTTITVNGLDTVVHIVRLYSAVSVVLLHEYNAEPKVDTVQVFDPIRFKIGDGGPNTPAADTDTFTHPALIGLLENEFLVHRNNVGVIFPGLNYNVDTPGGSIVLIPPDLFGDNEEFTIQMLPKQISTVVNDSVVGKWFGGFVDVAANTSYLPAHLRKLIRFSGTCSYSFLGTDTVPIGYGFAFQHFGAPGTGTINFFNGDVKLNNGTTNDAITIPNGSEGMFVWDGVNWNIVYLVKSVFGAVAAAPGTPIGSGLLNVGDPIGGSGDTFFTINHALNISGDYNVLLSIKANSSVNPERNDQMGYCWYHDTVDKPNNFKIVIKEIGNAVQNLSIFWLIIKA